MLAAFTVAVLCLCTWAYISSKRSGDGVDRELENLGSPRLAPRLEGKAVICGGGYANFYRVGSSLLANMMPAESRDSWPPKLV